METLELQGAKLRYHQVGQGPVLIFIPGANGTGDIFLPLAEQLKDHFTVVAVDRRDYGESELTEPLLIPLQTLTVIIVSNATHRTLPNLQSH